jgi:hypothetical protein
MAFPKIRAAKIFTWNSIKVKSPGKKEKVILLILLITGFYSLITFAVFLFNKENIGFPALYILLCISLSYKVPPMIREWYYFRVVEIPEKPMSSKVWEVKMLVPDVPEEPFKTIQKTFLAMKQVRCPHKTTYLCDKGNDALLRE